MRRKCFIATAMVFTLAGCTMKTFPPKLTEAQYSDSDEIAPGRPEGTTMYDLKSIGSVLMQKMLLGAQVTKNCFRSNKTGMIVYEGILTRVKV